MASSDDGCAGGCLWMIGLWIGIVIAICVLNTLSAAFDYAFGAWTPGAPATSWALSGFGIGLALYLLVAKAKPWKVSGSLTPVIWRRSAGAMVLAGVIGIPFLIHGCSY